MDELKNFISRIEKNINNVKKELDKMKSFKNEEDCFQDIA